MYMMAKHLHLTAVALSILFFVFRFIWSQFDAQALSKKWVKILPHVIDTILLASAIWLCVILSQYPFANAWLTFKLIGVVLYIVLGLFALKRAKSTVGRWAFFVAALAVLMATAMVAVTKQPLF
ncbi:SirB family protein [Alteromonas sp. KUL42]|uniref:SirB2 family protein n=1 Tax=Alteromonas sp. KUL42 TaxID=2480797 RepID=UPI000796590A|nr:SirB2 family protein [Alteromonas sp. KUL42]KXJ58861.1 MAG: invasion protein [Alteromonas sp. Nap_26]TAP34310.1 invasion protein [Alteromonas sp. KUL42]GEA07703.1 SirB family protein [Alteromonas sp. KUL42]